MSTDCCCICMEEIENVFAAKTACNHFYHVDCIAPWLEKAGTCPTCRDPIVKGSLVKIYVPFAMLKKIEDATSEHNTADNWVLIFAVCDEIKRKPDYAKDYVQLILKRIGHKDPKVADQAITLLDACIKNCNEKFHIEIASKEFEVEFQRLAGQATSIIKKKMCVSLKHWALNEFATNTQLSSIPSLYRKLKSMGYDFGDKPQQENRRATKRTLARDSSIAKRKLEICEICDGYVNDFDQMRKHMLQIHRLKLHPKIVNSHRPIGCKECEQRFFTDQGYERHLLGSHGLVTSSIQEAANNGEDKGRCPLCSKMFERKLLNHMTVGHKLELKPAHISFNCMTCGTTFGKHQLFINHVCSVHLGFSGLTGSRNSLLEPGSSNNNNTTAAIVSIVEASG